MQFSRFRRPLFCLCALLRLTRHVRSTKNRLSMKNSEARMDNRYTLPNLPYDYAALEPHYSARLLELHHDKHHAAYVAGANTTLEKLADARQKGDFATINQLQKNLAFHISGHVLHSLFWRNMSPHGGGEPDGELAAAIKESFGSVANLKGQLNEAALNVQGSDWGTLAWEPTTKRLVT